MPTKKLVVSIYGQYILIAAGVLVWAIALCTGRFFEGPDLAIPVRSWVGLTEIVPVLGAFLEAIPPVADDFTRALSVAALLLVAKRLERGTFWCRASWAASRALIVLFATPTAPRSTA